MTLSRSDALALLQLQADPDPARIDQAVQERLQRLQRLLDAASADALREKYQRQIEELQLARKALLVAPEALPGLTHTMMGDIPLAGPMGGDLRGVPLAPGLQPGSILSDRYEVAEVIGTGSMGVVYRAHDRVRGSDVAIKVLVPRLLASPLARQRFLEEARLASELSHPAIVNVFDVHLDGQHVFISMELLQGQTLRELLRQRLASRQLLDVPVCVGIASQIADALAHAHGRTVHRDVKPDNIWILPDGRAKLMDFGVARLLDARPTHGPTQERGPVGTAYYMAPEQLNRPAEVDARADQYGLAVTLHEMLLGQVPSGRIDPPHQRRKEVPPALSRAILRALSADPAERYPDIGSFKSAMAMRAGPWSALGALRRPEVAIGACVLALAWPAWRLVDGWQQGRAREAQQHSDALRLQGEARALLKQVQTQREERREATTAAQRELDRLEGELRSGRAGADRGALLVAYLAAQESAQRLAAADRRLRAALDGATGMQAIEGELNVGEAALKSADHASAAATFGRAVAALGALRDEPARLQASDAAERTRLIGAMAGQWSPGACTAASRWSAAGDRLNVVWPGSAETFVVRVVQALGDQVAGVVVSPPSQEGRVYRYTLQPERLLVHDLLEDRRAELKSCRSTN